MRVGCEAVDSTASARERGRRREIASPLGERRPGRPSTRRAAIPTGARLHALPPRRGSRTVPGTTSCDVHECPAFTLVELLVVIALLAILAGLLMPALSRALQEGKRVQCLNNLRQLAVAAHSYASNQDGYLSLIHI